MTEEGRVRERLKCPTPGCDGWTMFYPDVGLQVPHCLRCHTPWDTELHRDPDYAPAAGGAVRTGGRKQTSECEECHVRTLHPPRWERRMCWQCGLDSYRVLTDEEEFDPARIEERLSRAVWIGRTERARENERYLAAAMLRDMCRRHQRFVATDRYVAKLMGWSLSHTQHVLARVLQVDHLFEFNKRKTREIFLSRDHV